MSSAAVLTRIEACLGPTNPSAFIPLAAALMMNSGSGTQWCSQRPSDPWKNALGARESSTQVRKCGASGWSTFCQPPTVVAKTPCSSDAFTCWPRPVLPRTRIAALIPSVAM